MRHTQLINFLKKYNTISEGEKQNIENYFIPIQTKRKQILIDKYSSCNKLFFVNHGLLRIYYVNDKGKEVTRMIVGENNFLTNMKSFVGKEENQEIIECIEDTELLLIYKNDFERLIENNHVFKEIYIQLLELCNITHVNHLYMLGSNDIQQKIKYLKKYFPNLNKRVNDHILASFLGVSREYLVKNKRLF
ncbi:Crp/Fnr family transcriptional regulator [Chryseobacterium sp. RRHN12]|uniref:Crp/Fnr family transcriptional regulator n=1 Tax=Chryseobacterium sp. RRHN12 TaxID=3437884 RepID=UPI002FC8913B